MASVSLKTAPKEAAILDFDNSSESSDDEGSIEGFIRVSVPGAAAVGDGRELDTGNDEGLEGEEEEGDEDSDSDAWESDSLYEDTLDSLGDVTQFGPRGSLSSPPTPQMCGIS